MKKKFKRRQGWCDACDKDYVEQGKKCLHCGNKSYGVKVKKPNSRQIINDET